MRCHVSPPRWTLVLILFAGLTGYAAGPAAAPENPEFRTEQDVFGFDPTQSLDHHIESGRRDDGYGSWNVQRFFLICNPDLQSLDYLKTHVVRDEEGYAAGERTPFTAVGKKGTDLYYQLEGQMRILGDILCIKPYASLEECIDSLDNQEGRFLVLTVDIPHITLSDAGDWMEVCVAFKVFGLRFKADAHEASPRGRLDRCEFLYGDSAGERASTSQRPLDAFTECLVSAVQNKLAHSLVARVLGNSDSQWNPRQIIRSIPVPGPSISYYLSFGAWDQAAADSWWRLRRKAEGFGKSDYLELKYGRTER